MRELNDSNAHLADSDKLRATLRQQGYIYLREVLDPNEVYRVREAIIGTLDDAGWTASGRATIAPRPSGQARPESPTPEYFAWYERLQRLQAFHELAHDDSLGTIMEQLLDGPVLVHPRKIARASLPTGGDAVPTPPHQDYRLIQGTADTLTCWLPFGPCPVELGGLAVLDGSASRGLLPARPARGAGGLEVDDDTLWDEPDWLSSHFAAGDVLIFHSYTIHAALPNNTDSFRLSADYRFQLRSEPVVDRSLDAHYAPDIPSHTTLATAWTGTDSIAVPSGLDVRAMVDPLSPTLTAPPSRLLGECA